MAIDNGLKNNQATDSKSGVSSLVERQPHFVVDVHGSQHVFPVSLLREIVAGKRNPEEALGTEVVRSILSDFLDYVEDTK